MTLMLPRWRRQDPRKIEIGITCPALTLKPPPRRFVPILAGPLPKARLGNGVAFSRGTAGHRGTLWTTTYREIVGACPLNGH